MSKSSRIAALVLGLLLVLVVGSFLSYLGYCKYRTMHPTEVVVIGYVLKPESERRNLPSHQTLENFDPVKVNRSLAKHRDGAELFDQFKKPCIACIMMGLGLITLAIFRKSPPACSPQNSIPIDPLAD